MQNRGLNAVRPDADDESIDASYFLDFHDEAFLQQAYNKLLKRNPDPSGLAHYLRLIRDGESRYRVLNELAKSHEARKEGTRLTGMSGYRWMCRINTVPVLNIIAQTLIFVFRINAFLKDLRALENHLYRVSNQSDRF